MAKELDILRKCKAALESAGYPAIKLRPLEAGEEGVSIRLLPAITQRTYMDGTEDIEQQIDVFARMQDEGAAITLSSDAASRIAASGSLSGTSYVVTDARVSAGATEAEQPENGLHGYSATVTIYYTYTPSDFS